jgi:hypothetical protein
VAAQPATGGVFFSLRNDRPQLVAQEVSKEAAGIAGLEREDMLRCRHKLQAGGFAAGEQSLLCGLLE